MNYYEKKSKHKKLYDYFDAQIFSIELQFFGNVCIVCVCSSACKKKKRKKIIVIIG